MLAVVSSMTNLRKFQSSSRKKWHLILGSTFIASVKKNLDGEFITAFLSCLLEFEQDNLSLGLKVGQAIRLSKPDKTVSRCYTPISSIWDQGCVDIIVKTFRKGEPSEKPNNSINSGFFGEYLEEMKENDKVILDAPHGRFYYEGGGNFFCRSME